MSSQAQRVAIIATIIIAVLLVVIAGLARRLMQVPAAAPAVAPVATSTPTTLPTLTATSTPEPTATTLPTPTVTNTPLPTPTPTALPVPSWSEASKLTSLEYLNTAMIERERPKEGIDQVIPGKDRIMMMVVGKIHAGVDLEKLPVRKIEIKGKSINLVLPRAQILAVELLPEESRIYESDRTWLYSNYEGLEKEALEEARAKLQENNAHNQKMLQMAEKLARLQLTELLRNLGYDNIVITFE